jgi:hypothetical protein
MNYMNDRSAVWFVIGVGGAVALGFALTGLRGHATASTLAFPFLALTIVVAETGGRARDWPRPSSRRSA